MTRNIILGNGNMLVCLDKNARIRDFYYPYVGQENHVASNIHRTGVYIDGKFSWVNEDDWDLFIKYKKDALVSEIYAYNSDLEIELKINEIVHYEKNIFLRKVEVQNKSPNKRNIKVFFSQNFNISDANVGDTVYYDPISESLINYKGKRYFLIGGESEGKVFDDFATGGAQGVDNKQGTYVDCENGELSKNPIEHGAVDSSIGFSRFFEANETKEIDYWICVGKKHGEIIDLKNFIKKIGTQKMMKETEKYWINWLDNKKIDFSGLDQKIIDLFRRSLLIVRAQTDNGGAIIAANDTHTFHFKKDTYSYMWPRDGALIARSLDRVGHKEITTKFFKFCSRLIVKEGYLLHKYLPDGSYGSSWHSWLNRGKIQLPIQEDETSLVLDALWKHYEKHGDEEMIKEIYESFIKKAADFMTEFRYEDTKLPKQTYDLWEEKLGVHTFTCSTVYAGLIAASKFAEKFGKKVDSKKYVKAAKEVKEAIIKYLYDEEMKVFVKGVYFDENNNMKKDYTVDSSTFYSLFEYGILDIDDPKMIQTAEITVNRLWSVERCGGMGRYEKDHYYKKYPNLNNPWIISTMWLCEYYIKRAKKVEELKPALDLLNWANQKALDSGVLSEQLDPITCNPLSVAPLTWSHAGFIIAVVKYLDKFKELSK